MLEATAEVVLNAADLEVSEARLVGAGGRSVEVTVNYRPEEEQLVLGAPEALAPGPWRLDLRFAGRLNDRLRGFYRSKYKGKDGEETWLAATQFESTDARRRFPMLGRTGLEGDFRGDCRGRGRPDRPRQRQGDLVRGRRRRQTAHPFRRHPADVHLHSGRRHRALRTERDEERGRRPSAHRLRARAWCPAGRGRGGSRPRSVFPQQLLLDALPGGQARPCRHPRLRRRGHGELGPGDLPRDGVAGGRGKPLRSNVNGWCRPSPTRRLTCGSATSSPCAGGRGSG